MAVRIRTGDIVEVISGDHKGQRGKVLRINTARGLLVVEGVNMVYRHVRPTRRNPQGGRLHKEAPIRLCKVLPYDARAGKASRIRFEVTRNAAGQVVKKERVFVKSGTVLSEVTRAEREARTTGG